MEGNPFEYKSIDNFNSILKKSGLNVYGQPSYTIRIRSFPAPQHRETNTKYKQQYGCNNTEIKQ
jgi:hypothetical protein